jgi:hypothetical protein
MSQHLDVSVVPSQTGSSATVSSRAFSAIRMNERPGKPQHVGITEIRGPYYTSMGPRYLEDILDTMGVLVQGDDRIGAVAELVGKLADAKIDVIAIDAVAVDERYGALCWAAPRSLKKAASILGVS